MPLFLLPILTFLKAYWKPILIVLLVIAVVLGLYLKGRSDAKHSFVLQEYKETVKSIESQGKVIKRGKEFSDKVTEHRLVEPIDDERDSCLLSAQSPTEECGKYLQPKL
jgi:hypothetical protein